MSSFIFCLLCPISSAISFSFVRSPKTSFFSSRHRIFWHRHLLSIQDFFFSTYSRLGELRFSRVNLLFFSYLQEKKKEKRLEKYHDGLQKINHASVFIQRVILQTWEEQGRNNKERLSKNIEFLEKNPLVCDLFLSINVFRATEKINNFISRGNEKSISS